jgi:hypothetical protein
MSWIMHFATGETPKGPTAAAGTTTPPPQPLIGEDGLPPPSPMGDFPRDDTYPRVEDPSIKGRMVSTRQSNRPFLSCVSFFLFFVYLFVNALFSCFVLFLSPWFCCLNLRLTCVK